MYCIGDGKTPRTAAIFAFMSKWTCVSVDPQMSVFEGIEDPPPWASINRLRFHGTIIEDVPNHDDLPENAVIVMIHAHVSFWNTIRSIGAKKKIAVVSCSCCNWLPEQSFLAGEPSDVEYEDLSVMSAKRTVKIWNVRDEKTLRDFYGRTGDERVAPLVKKKKRQKKEAKAKTPFGSSLDE